MQEELGERQREMFLREQLKTIQRELGEGDERDDLQELREKLEALDLPAEARKEVDRELGRLTRIGRESMESQVIRTFLENVAELPWNVRSKEHLQLPEAQTILDEDHYALGDVKDRVLEFLAVRQLRMQQDAADRAADEAKTVERKAEEVTQGESTDTPQATATVPAPNAVIKGNDDDRARGPILLFVGPPGVGKTSVAKSIARAMGRKYVRISLGGARDEADIRGHRRTYVGAMPGRIINGMKQAGTKNPVFLLDEVDKLGVSFQGDPASALLEVLDPAQNDSFVDHYLGVPFDLSEVLFIATANFIQNIPGPLLDRMEVVDFAGYTEREKQEIARKYLIPRQFTENGVSPARLTITDEALAEVITELHPGVRRPAARAGDRPAGAQGGTPVRLRRGRDRSRWTRTWSTICSAVPRSIRRRWRGTTRWASPRGCTTPRPAATSCSSRRRTMRGKGELVLTGQLGDVMKESARAAWTYARSHAAGLQIQDEMFDRDIHIHVPAGAIPKDGPSAGVTMASAVVSTLSGRPGPPRYRHDR